MRVTKESSIICTCLCLDYTYIFDSAENSSDNQCSSLQGSWQKSQAQSMYHGLCQCPTLTPLSNCFLGLPLSTGDTHFSICPFQKSETTQANHVPQTCVFLWRETTMVFPSAHARYVSLLDKNCWF